MFVSLHSRSIAYNLASLISVRIASPCTFIVAALQRRYVTLCHPSDPGSRVRAEGVQLAMEFAAALYNRGTARQCETHSQFASAVLLFGKQKNQLHQRNVQHVLQLTLLLR